MDSRRDRDLGRAKRQHQAMAPASTARTMTVQEFKTYSSEPSLNALPAIAPTTLSRTGAPMGIASRPIDSLEDCRQAFP